MIRLALTLITLAFALPAKAQVPIQEVTSPGGIKAWYVQEPSIPFVALNIYFRGGTVLDEPGKRGATDLMAGLLEEGAGDLDSRGYAEAKQDLATTIDFDIYDDTLTVAARYLTAHEDASVELIRVALEEPTFPEDAVERVRGQLLAYLTSRETEPEEIAGDLIDAAAFGDHPYASFGTGTVESVSALTRDDIITAWKNAIARDRVYVGAAGDITPERLGALLDTIFGGLPETGAPFPDEVPFAAAPGISITPFDTPQAVARFGQPGIKITSPDFFAAYLVNNIMGAGGFQSRLTTEVRKNRGLTYSIGTWLSDSDYTEVLGGTFNSTSANMAEAIGVVQAEWERIATEGVTAEELETAKTYLTGSYPLRFDGNANIARILTSMQYDGFPIDYPVTRNDRVMAVTLEEANRVAAALYQPENLRFVIVGNVDGLEPTVE